MADWVDELSKVYAMGGSVGKPPSALQRIAGVAQDYAQQFQAQQQKVQEMKTQMLSSYIELRKANVSPEEANKAMASIYGEGAVKGLPTTGGPQNPEELLTKIKDIATKYGTQGELDVNSKGETTMKFKTPDQQLIGSLGDVSNKTPEQAMADLKKTNPAKAAMYQKIADGKMVMGSGRTSKQQLAMMSDLSYLYPGLDQTQLNQRVSTRKDFQSGTTSNNITSGRTVIGHLGKLYDLIGTLKNSNIPIWNKMVNFEKTQTGQAQIKEFNITKQLAVQEMAKMVKGSVATEGETQQLMKNINSSDSPEQLYQTVGTSIDLIKSKLDALQAKWKDTFNLPTDKPFPILNKETQDILDKITANATHADIGTPTQTKAPADLNNPKVQSFIKAARAQGWGDDKIQQYLQGKS